MVLSGAVLGGILTIIGVLITVLAGVIAWIVLRVLDLTEEMNTLSESYGGSEYDTGHLEETRQNFQRIHSRLDDIEDSISYQERRRLNEHEELRSLVGKVVESLRDSGINGSLPSPDEIESSDD